MRLKEFKGGLIYRVIKPLIMPDAEFYVGAILKCISAVFSVYDSADKYTMRSIDGKTYTFWVDKIDGKTDKKDRQIFKYFELASPAEQTRFANI